MELYRKNRELNMSNKLDWFIELRALQARTYDFHKNVSENHIGCCT